MKSEHPTSPPGPVAAGTTRQIEARRKALGWTIEELSNRLALEGQPIPRLGLTRLQAGQRRLTVDELAAFARVFGVADPWELTGGIACHRCSGQPPAGFRCVACEREGVAA